MPFTACHTHHQPHPHPTTHTHIHIHIHIHIRAPDRNETGNAHTTHKRHRASTQSFHTPTPNMTGHKETSTPRTINEACQQTKQTKDNPHPPLIRAHRAP